MMNSESDDQLIVEAERLAAYATVGPWSTQHGIYVVSTPSPGGPIPANLVATIRDRPHGGQDAEFIARSRTLVPQLAERLDSVSETVRAQFARAVEREEEISRLSAENRAFRIALQSIRELGPPVKGPRTVGEVARDIAAEALGGDGR